MKLRLSHIERVGEGVFADVFSIGDGTRVCKVYRSAGSDKWREWAPVVHQQELLANELAAKSADTRSLVAACYGAVEIESVHDAAGIDVSDQYLLGTGIAFERLTGPEEKAWGLDPERHPYVGEIMELFSKAGVDASDASAFGIERRETLRFIDITTPYGARIITETAFGVV